MASSIQMLLRGSALNLTRREWARSVPVKHRLLHCEDDPIKNFWLADGLMFAFAHRSHP